MKEGGIGIGKGTASLLGNTVSGITNSVSGITDTVGTGMAMLSFDDNYM